MNIHWLIKIWNFQGGWSKILTACVLLGSMLQTSVPVAVHKPGLGDNLILTIKLVIPTVIKILIKIISQ